ncbi:hypothetical protein BFU26_09350 [Campylobacter coli]|nr:hypothetical protein [Campylobacter coli]
MKKIILGLALIASLSSVASAYKITVSQQPIVQPHYEGCVLVYQYGREDNVNDTCNTLWCY